MKQELLVRVTYLDNGGGTKEYRIPFETGRHNFPNEYPFTKNVYIGPDAGFSLGYLSIDAEKRQITLAYADLVKLDKEGKGRFVLNLKPSETITFDFLLIN